MANLILNNLPFFITGDGSSTTAIIPLGFTPLTITFVEALETSNGQNVTSNVASATLVGTNVNIVFNAPFSYIVTLIFDIAPVLPLLSGSVQVSSPWLCSSAPSTTASAPASTPVTSTSSSILAANSSRLEVTIVNTGTVPVYLGLNGKTPTSSAYHIALSPCTTAGDGTGGTYVSDSIKGAINAITASTSGSVVVTELTA
jgi:hypothetical protein